MHENNTEQNEAIISKKVLPVEMIYVIWWLLISNFNPKYTIGPFNMATH